MMDSISYNSPLYQYLQDLGHTDFEVCSSLSPKPEKCTVTEGQQKPPARALPKRGILLKVAETIKSWILVQCSKNDDLLHKLDIGFRLNSLHTILQQEVLLQEDVELIELLDPSVLSAGQPQQQENGHLPTLCSLATPSIWDVSVLFAFISLLIMLPTWWIVSSWLLWGVILFVYLIIRALRLWRTAKLQITLKKYNVYLEDIATNSRGFTNLVRKALRLIQETEVISRGFTLLLDRVSAACPFNKAGQHPSQHLIGLRKAVYRTVRANFQAARLATLYMLKNYPLNSESDNVTNYICVVPFKELGLGLSEEQISEEEAHNLTAGFSLPALKVLFQLWVAQSSEFFRRLALLLSTANSPPGPLLTPALLPHHILSDVTQGLPHAHSACLEELKRSYEFYRYFETQHQSVPQRLSKTQQKSRELNNVHTAVRSLQLHLKALLNEVIVFEDELEKLVCTKETQELVSEAYQILEQKLKLIQPHVQASNNCWEEAISQVDKLLRRNTDKKGKPEMACENPHCTVVPLMQPPLHIADKDPIPEEQELEAYVDDIDMDSDFRKDDFYYLSQEDRERQEREHEESKRVLQELKSVLGFKASEAERQKWKQLLFSDHAVLKSLCPVDPVEPISNSEPSVDSDMGKVCKNDTEEENNKPSTTDNEISNRTEYLCEYPLDGKDKDNSANEVFLQGAEERVYYQCESEDESQQADAGGLAPAHPTHGASPQPSIKQRLAQLQLSPDFTFTAGLAAEVAARSLSFTTMQEQTFGDEEEEQIMQENENEVEEK
ncbi:vezatin isoform X2 [Physeter macrocephalus]|uniref:Vezatin n=1 Tax=Physeter macrocephalus TaxID=9755 RepID=A0A455BC24_PHYMC|nr:vezatin isoform X2 [Physeter catodon]XP_054941226.1 vezatin isoform X2 [Physeter catodon]XP_054941227.1 vezatin isoform X2 [Physeter catodon]|eukprot:XP_028346259.1 vezatin isoform X2 [Physeter catodon]